MTTLHDVADTLSRVECEDLRVAVLLVHPEDVPVLSAHDDYESLGKSEPRPEWGGNLVGHFWGTSVISTIKVEAGYPDAIPDPGGVQCLVAYLKDAREHWHKYEPPSPRDPNMLQQVVSKTKIRLIKLLGGKPPFNRLTRVNEEVNVRPGHMPQG